MHVESPKDEIDYTCLTLFELIKKFKEKNEQLDKKIFSNTKTIRGLCECDAACSLQYCLQPTTCSCTKCAWPVAKCKLLSRYSQTQPGADVRIRRLALCLTSESNGSGSTFVGSPCSQ